VKAGAPVREALVAIEPISTTVPSMGGRLAIHIDAEPGQPGRADAARMAERQVVARVDRWSSRLTRHADTSELSLLNADPRTSVNVRPILAAALLAGMTAADASEGLADITLLDARLTAEGMAAEGMAAEEAGARPHRSRVGEWQVVRRRRGAAVVRRPPGLRFDLGGVAKGWIADRALRMLASWPSAVVDADGDLALRCAPGKFWAIGVDDPRTPNTNLAILRLGAPAGGAAANWGVATSGTSIHRWKVNGSVSHHLIDPRTGRPAQTDVVQATVVAGSALRAEALAKAVIIAGSRQGLALLERARVRGAVLLTESGEVLALPETLSLLAA